MAARTRASTRCEVTRGAAAGYPGLTLDDAGDVPCLLFELADLPGHWARLDAFEGSGYRRVRTFVDVSDGERCEAYVYELSGR